MSETVTAIDFETYSVAELSDCGADAYARHPSTEILCMAWAVGDGPVSVWWPGEPFPDLQPPFSAWNAPFEMAIVEHVLPGYGALLPTGPEDWRCTMAASLRKGLPGKLEAAAKVLGVPEKLSAGLAVMRRHSKPRKPTKVDPSTRHTLTPEDRAFLGAYCAHDVEMERDVARHTGTLPGPHQEQWASTVHLNRRGIGVDVAMCEGAVAIAAREAADAVARLVEVTGGAVTSGSQLARIKAWCAGRGVTLHSVTTDTVADALKGDLPGPVREVLTLRQKLSKSSTTKYEAMLRSRGPDGRVRGVIQYHGAATGRDAGRLFQPQNLPRPSEAFEKFSQDDLETAAQVVATGDSELVRACYGDPEVALPALVRAALVAGEGKRFVASDLAGIENRIVAALAGETWKLDMFRDYDKNGGRDLYCRAADKVFGFEVTKKNNPQERHVGKILELASGFGGWVNAWRNFDSSDAHTDEDVARYMGAWREQHPKLVRMWYAYERAAIAAVRTGKPHTTNHVTYLMRGQWLVAELPSKRTLWYRNPRIEVEPHRYRDEDVAVLYAEVWKAGQWNTVSLYGGLLTENNVQAIARDVMMDGAARAEALWAGTVLRVHDEIVAELPHGCGSAEELAICLTTEADWLKPLGVPLAAAGWEGRRFWK